MNGRQTSGVTADHGLDHVQSLTTADFADDDPVGPHSERGAKQIPNRHTAPAITVSLLSFQVQRMLLSELQLRAVFDHDNPLILGHGGRHGIQHGRLTGSRSTGNDDVLLKTNTKLQKLFCLY